MALFNSLNDEGFVLQIQRILRDLNFIDGEIGRVGVDGYYDEGTRSEVMRFQEKYGLDPSGVVDFETWELLNKIWQVKLEENELARAIYVLPRFEGYEIQPFAKDNAIFIIQHMLETISRDYESISVELNGIYDQPTQDAIMLFKRKNLLDNTSVIDARTFNRLADEYERINSRSQ